MALVLAQVRDELEAAELRHLEVRDHEIVAELARHLERARAVLGDVDDPPLAPEHAGHGLADRARVIDHERATGEHGRGGGLVVDGAERDPGICAPHQLRGIEDQLDLARAADRRARVERERGEQRSQRLDDDLARAHDLVDRAHERLAGEGDDHPGPPVGGRAMAEQALEAKEWHVGVVHRDGRSRGGVDLDRATDVDVRDRVDLATDLEEHRVRERGRQREAQRERGAAAGRRAEQHLAAELRDRLADEAQADPASRELVGLSAHGDPAGRVEREQSVEDVGVVGELRAGRAPLPGGHEALAQRGRVDAAAVVAHLEDEQAPVLARPERDRRARGLAGGDSLLRWLDPVGNRVAQELGDRIDELLGDGLVELRVLPGGAQLDLDAGRAAEGPEGARGVEEQRARALHTDAREAALELPDGATEGLDLVEERGRGLAQQRRLTRELVVDERERAPSALRVAARGALRIDRLVQRLPRAGEVARECAQELDAALDARAIEQQLAGARHERLDALWLDAQHGLGVGHHGALDGGDEHPLGGRLDERRGQRARATVGPRDGIDLIAEVHGEARGVLALRVVEVIEIAAHPVGDLDELIARARGPRHGPSGDPRERTLEAVREVDDRGHPDGARGALERVRDPHHLGQGLGGRNPGAPREHARRDLLERILGLGAKQPAQHRELLGVEVELALVHAPGPPPAAVSWSRAMRTMRTGSSRAIARPSGSITASSRATSEATRSTWSTRSAQVISSASRTSAPSPWRGVGPGPWPSTAPTSTTGRIEPWRFTTPPSAGGADGTPVTNPSVTTSRIQRNSTA